MVGDLLHIHLRPVSKRALESLSEDRVQRLVENMARLHEAERSDHHEFHAFYGVLGLGGGIHVQWAVLPHRGDQVKDRVMRHAPDWEADRREVELAAEDGAADLLDHVLECASVFRQDFSVVQGEAAILVRAFFQPVVVL